MNAWLIAATALMVGARCRACGSAPASGPLDAVVALELASTITTLDPASLLAQGYRRDPFMDLALVSALLSFAGALTFVRFLERWV